MPYAILTVRLKLLIIACNSSSLLALGGLIASCNRLGSFSFKCRTQPTCFNYKLSFTFSSASLTFSLAFFLICSNLSTVIFCTFTYMSSSKSLLSTASSLITLKNPCLSLFLKNCWQYTLKIYSHFSVVCLFLYNSRPFPRLFSYLYTIQQCS